MKKKELFSLLLVMVMCISIGLLISILFTTSTSATGTGSIIINNPENLSLEGEIFKAYKIFDTTVGTPTNPNAYVYTVTAEFGKFDAYKSYAGYEDGQTLFDWFHAILGDDQTSDVMTTLASDLRDYIIDRNIGTAYTETGTSSGVTIDGLPCGYYLVCGFALSDDNQVVETCALKNVTLP